MTGQPPTPTPDPRGILAHRLTVLLDDRWTELDRFMAAVDEYVSRLPQPEPLHPVARFLRDVRLALRV